MATTPNLGVTELSASQSQKHVTMNAALRRYDALLSLPTIIAIDRDLATPPGSPADGDTYIVATSPTGAWTGHTGDIAYYNSTGWQFFDAGEGWIVYLEDENTYVQYDGAAWVGFPQQSQNLSLLGINTTADSTNKLAVKSNAVLFTAVLAADGGDGDMRYKVNKEADGDVASFLFQKNFLGFAEFGLIGDNDFTLKVSPDNFSTSFTALVVDKDDGRCKFLGLGTTAATELTIAAGVVAVTQTAHKVDTEADAASDDLDTINGGYEGAIIILEPANDARTVVITQAGNIKTASGASVSLDNYGDSFMARYDGTNWIQL